MTDRRNRESHTNIDFHRLMTDNLFVRIRYASGSAQKLRSACIYYNSNHKYEWNVFLNPKSRQYQIIIAQTIYALLDTLDIVS